MSVPVRHLFRMWHAARNNVPVWREYPTRELAQAIASGHGEAAALRELERRFARLVYSLLASEAQDPDDTYEDAFREAVREGLYAGGAPRFFTLRLREIVERRLGEHARARLAVTFFRRHFVYDAGYAHGRVLEAFDDAWQPGMDSSDALRVVSGRLLIGSDALGSQIRSATRAVRAEMLRRGDVAVRTETGDRYAISDLFKEARDGS